MQRHSFDFFNGLVSVMDVPRIRLGPMNFAWIIVTACAFSMITIAQAGNYTTVAVGKDGKLTFDPPFVSNFVGGTIDSASGRDILVGGLIFQSYKANPLHNISESTFEQPCVSKPGGVWFSGAPKERPFAELGWIFSMGSEPLWFHVSTGSRCAAGMVFAVNPTGAQTYEAFRARAMATNASSGSPSLPSNSTSAFLKTTSSSIQKITAALAGMIFLLQLLLL